MPQIKAPMAGTILEVLVAPGDAVALDAEILVLESMKMEIPVEAPVAGTVKTVHVAEGDPVQEDDPLVDID